MDQIDVKFINLSSPYLRNFKKKPNSNPPIYNFSCPYCGDSKKNLSKARGFLFDHKTSKKPTYHCHNCNVTHTFKDFLEFVDSSLFRQYCIEKFKENKTCFGGVGISDIDSTISIKDETKKIYLDEFCDTIEALPDNHYAKIYIQSRFIPKRFYNSLYFTKNFLDLIKLMGIEDSKQELKGDSRIIIPFYKDNGDLFCIQGRLLSSYGGNNLRYITLMINKTDSHVKIFGLNHWNPAEDTFILEGPFDSMFVDNGLAMAGSSINFNDPTMKRFNKEKTFFIFDNEPNNKEICKEMKKVLDNGYGLFIWPKEHFDCKDINELALKVLNYDKVNEIVRSNLVRGLDGYLNLVQFIK